MKALKEAKRTVPVEIDITGVTLLSAEEYEENRDIIPAVDEGWWLRSPGRKSRNHAAAVGTAGSIGSYSVNVNQGRIRPAAYYGPKSAILRCGGKVFLAGYRWTVLRNRILLCDETVALSAFREDSEAEDANDFEKSDAKWTLDTWAKDVGLIEDEEQPIEEARPSGLSVCMLVANASFPFNAPYRIVEYIPAESSEEEGECRVVFESSLQKYPPFEVLQKEIIAINEGDDGVLEIEYVNTDLY